MSTSAGTSQFAALGIENTNIQTAPGVTLDDKQKLLVGSVLDVNAPHPSTTIFTHITMGLIMT